MIEYTLEELISFNMSLAYEFNPDNLEPEFENVNDAINKTKRFFLDNELFVKTYEQSINGFNLEKDIDDLIPLAMMYVYYFGLDYILRKSGKIHTLNTVYLRECISSDKLKSYLTIDENRPATKEMIDSEISLKLSEFYDYMRKQKPQFFNAVCRIQDPKHVNPYFDQEEKDFFGQIPKYFRKIFNIEYSESAKNNLEQIKAMDLLPAISLGAIGISDLLPTSSKTKSGSLNFSRLEKIDKVLKNRIEISQDVEGSKCTKLLYELAVEDLFFMNRLNNAVIKYLDFNLEYKYRNHTKYQEEKILRGVFAPYLFLPSCGQQEKYSEIIYGAADMLSKGGVKLREIFNKVLPALFSSNVLFPQLLVVLSNYLFSDNSNHVISEELMKDRINLIEAYICDNEEKISTHICDNKPRLWNAREGDKYIEIKTENKGLKKGNKYDNELETRYSFQKEIRHKFTKLNIERISRLLIDPEFRWKSNSIIERNMGLREYFKKMNINWHDKYAFPRYRNGTLEADVIVSTEYFMFLTLVQFEYAVEMNVQLRYYPTQVEQLLVKVPMF